MLSPKTISAQIFISADKLFKELETNLVSISSQNNNILSLADLSRIACEESLSKLKDLILNSSFKNKAEEIYFFKKVKPKFTSKLHYFIHLFDLERRRIFNTLSSQIEYFEKALCNLNFQHQDNIEFYTYYRIDSTALDDKYFVRSELNIHLAHSSGLFNYDRNFSTNRDSHVAQILTNDLLAIYIISELEKLREEKTSAKLIAVSNLNWTDTKASLTVLVYAFHSYQCFNNGKSELKEIAQAFSKLCNVDLGDFYRTWAEIKLKKDPTKFLDALKISVHNRINSDLE
ncbi:RteC domain-containing protein [Aurantibacillus circumpalustris]|uniref:RteC domain-containing protein n=1 Tax=Aurantibacillus circumpalustris TaxID=3036359 RepID=UPI00295BFE8C|nr:RteC domain-containing protein [Aurantibacillus circumpalustris]